MVERNTFRLWAMRATFVALGLATIFVCLLPLQTGPARWPTPDILLALCLAWSLRRPDFAPVLCIGALMLLADLMFQRPPGLFAAMTVIASEAMRRRGPGLRDAGFATEMLTVALSIAVITIAYRVALTLLVLPRPPLGLSLVQAMLTIAAYPLVVVVSQLVLGVRTQTQAELASGRGRA